MAVAVAVVVAEERILWAGDRTAIAAHTVGTHIAAAAAAVAVAAVAVAAVVDIAVVDNFPGTHAL